MKHRSEVIYTNNDDGIWIWCYADSDGEPHWSVCLDFFPSVDQIAAAWAGHLQEDE